MPWWHHNSSTIFRVCMGLMTSQLCIFRARSILLAFVVPKLILIFATEGLNAQPYSINIAATVTLQSKSQNSNPSDSPLMRTKKKSSSLVKLMPAIDYCLLLLLLLLLLFLLLFLFTLFRLRLSGGKKLKAATKYWITNWLRSRFPSFWRL